MASSALNRNILSCHLNLQQAISQSTFQSNL